MVPAAIIIFKENRPRQANNNIDQRLDATTINSDRLPAKIARAGTRVQIGSGVACVHVNAVDVRLDTWIGNEQERGSN